MKEVGSVFRGVIANCSDGLLCILELGDDVWFCRHMCRLFPCDMNQEAFKLLGSVSLGSDARECTFSVS